MYSSQPITAWNSQSFERAISENTFEKYLEHAACFGRRKASMDLMCFPSKPNSILYPTAVIHCWKTYCLHNYLVCNGTFQTGNSILFWYPCNHGNLYRDGSIHLFVFILGKNTYLSSLCRALRDALLHGEPLKIVPVPLRLKRDDASPSSLIERFDML